MCHSFCNSSVVFAVDLIEWLSVGNWFGNIPFLETGLQVLKVIANNLYLMISILVQIIEEQASRKKSEGDCM